MKWFFLTVTATALSLVSSQDFDYYTFTQEWPPTFCMNKQCNYPTNIVTGFNVHGLWPSSRSGDDPEHCHEGRPFDVKSLLPILDQLKVAWANLEAYNDPSEFWSYEWKTHGRCALSNDVTSTELKFFNATLSLKRDLALEKGLTSKSIVPGDKVYSTRDIYDAMKELYGVQTELRCSFSDGQAYLSEVRVCYDKRLKIIDCPVNLFQLFFGRRLGTNPCPDGIIIPTAHSLWKRKLMKMSMAIDKVSLDKDIV